MPRGKVGSWVAVETLFGGLIEVDALPGRYLLVTQDFLAEVDVGEGAAVANFGAREAVVRADPGARVYLVPMDATVLEMLVSRLGGVPQETSVWTG